MGYCLISQCKKLPLGDNPFIPEGSSSKQGRIQISFAYLFTGDWPYSRIRIMKNYQNKSFTLLLIPDVLGNGLKLSTFQALSILLCFFFLMQHDLTVLSLSFVNLFSSFLKCK